MGAGYSPAFSFMWHPLINYLIAVALFSTNIFFPQFGFILTFFSPILILKYLMDDRVTVKEHVGALILTCSLAFFSIFFFVYFLLLCVYPAFIVNLILNKKNNTKIDVVAIGALPMFVFALITIFFLDEYRTAIIEYMAKYIDIVTENYKNQGGNFESNSYLQYLKTNRDTIAYTIVHLMPSLSFVYSVLLTVMCRKYYFRRLSLPEVRYRVNDKLIVFLIVGGFFILSKDFSYKLVSYNTLIIFTALFFFQGLDILNFYFLKWKLSYFLKLILYILIFSEPHMIIIVAVLGLFDNWFDMTKISFKRKMS
ncbi:YybS family protein [Deferribacterales bacterium Es71-Z0220]|uniref:DUF2232 domain-containing protein n=1 Tax=Deferrivibrio essentukiensis TaxID=2880922 RepID=UPI001F62066F|nr:DUF2232 domain-containing protein [Deferrivibrio essentukiensis]MCB4203708.1 YybS family protein [Deferrivibrio essentukiensis]